jgi:hypothetical protein
MTIRSKLTSFVAVGFLATMPVPRAVDAAPAGRATLNNSAPKWATASNYVGAVDASASRYMPAGLTP